MDDRERYIAAAQAMQTGVAMEMNYDPGPTQPKHLRVGVNAAMRDQASLVRLLIAKGIISEDEYLKAVADGMEEEADEYQQRIQQHVSPQGGSNITLR